jgi:hypothetical protein
VYDGELFAAVVYHRGMDRFRAALALVVVIATVAACGDQPPSSPGPITSPSPPSGSPVTPSASANASPSADPSVPAASVAWAPLTAGGDGPEPRFGHTWVADPSDAAAYLFGGAGASGPLDDLWRYDFGADSWEPRAPDGPSPRARSGHAAVLVDDMGLVVLGGTAGDGAVLDDAWVYSPLSNDWTERSASGDLPPPRTNACAAVAPDGRVWVSHGFGPDGAALDDTWALDPLAWSWTRIGPPEAVPPPRGGHGCWWTIDGRLVLHGGRAEGVVLGDTWVFDAAAPGSEDQVWSSVETVGSMAPRSDFGSTLVSDTIVIVAGQGADGQALGDVIGLEPDSLTPESFVADGQAPDPRTGTAIVDDPGNERSLLFGGAVDGIATDELWSFDLR